MFLDQLGIARKHFRFEYFCIEAASIWRRFAWRWVETKPSVSSVGRLRFEARPNVSSPRREEPTEERAVNDFRAKRNQKIVR
jgi:hypothetical protein